MPQTTLLLGSILHQKQTIKRQLSAGSDPTTRGLGDGQRRFHDSCGADQAFGQFDLAAYVVARRGRGAAPRTIKLELRIAGILFRWAQDEGVVSATARLRVPRIKIDPERFVINHRTPTPAEAGRAIAAMDDDDWKLAASLLARTGARIGEIVALCGSDLDLPTRRIALGGHDGASKTGLRWFPLDDNSLAGLGDRAARGDRSLFDFGVTAPIQGMQRRLREACERGGVPLFTPHGLRRMVVGRLLRSGVDAGRADKLTGHSVQVMLRYYQEVTDEDRRAAADLASLGELPGRVAGSRTAFLCGPGGQGGRSRRRCPGTPGPATRSGSPSGRTPPCRARYRASRPRSRLPAVVAG